MAGDTTPEAPTPEQWRIAGEVRLMTDEPVELPGDMDADRLVVQITRVLSRRPWLAPASLIGLVLLVLLLRKRR